MIKAIGSFFSAIAAVFQAKEGAAKRANTPEMKANARAKTKAEIKKDAAEAVKKRDLNDIRNRLSLIAISLCLLSLTIGPGCASTVSPDRVEQPTTAVFDRDDTGEATSGILSLEETGAVISQEARDRYNSLIREYGDEFRPKIRKDYGITSRDTTPPTFFINNAGLQRFIEMTEYARMGLE